MYETVAWADIQSYLLTLISLLANTMIFADGIGRAKCAVLVNLTI